MYATTIHRNNRNAIIAIGLFIWAFIVFTIGHQKLFENLPNTTIGFVIIGITTILLLIRAFVKPFQQTIDNIPLRSFAWLHAFRIIGGITFIANMGNLPGEFVLNAGYGDIISGISAIAVLTIGQTKLNYIIFNTIGTLDLLNALRLGLVIGLSGDDRIKALGEMPYIMIILFIVPILIFTHLISFQRLIKAKSINWNQKIK
jgi:hypothetical protein